MSMFDAILSARQDRNVRDQYFGKYRAIVVGNNDPETLGRIKVVCPRVYGVDSSGTPVQSGWCLPSGSLGEDAGWYALPERGTIVWLEFEEGNPNMPLWTPGPWVKGTAPYEGRRVDPQTRVLKSPGGHTIEFIDDLGKEKLRLSAASGQSITLDSQANKIDLTTFFGTEKEHSVQWDGRQQQYRFTDQVHRITIDGAKKDEINGVPIPNGNGHKITIEQDYDPEDVLPPKQKIELQGDDVVGTLTAKLTQGDDVTVTIETTLATKKATIQVAGTILEIDGTTDMVTITSAAGIKLGSSTSSQPLVLGFALLAWLNSHTHGHPMGPTTPPATPALPASLLSAVHKTE